MEGSLRAEITTDTPSKVCLVFTFVHHSMYRFIKKGFL
jgi:hypothetical protein